MIEVTKRSFVNNKDTFTTKILNSGESEGVTQKKENLRISYTGTEEGGEIIILLNHGQPNVHRFDFVLNDGSDFSCKDLGIEIKARKA